MKRVYARAVGTCVVPSAMCLGTKAFSAPWAKAGACRAQIREARAISQRSGPKSRVACCKGARFSEAGAGLVGWEGRSEARVSLDTRSAPTWRSEGL